MPSTSIEGEQGWVAALDVFEELHAQMINTGLPAEDVDAVRDRITAMWPDTSGGWVYEWSALAPLMIGWLNRRLCA